MAGWRHASLEPRCRLWMIAWASNFNFLCRCFDIRINLLNKIQKLFECMKISKKTFLTHWPLDQISLHMAGQPGEAAHSVEFDDVVAYTGGHAHKHRAIGVTALREPEKFKLQHDVLDKQTHKVCPFLFGNMI